MKAFRFQIPSLFWPILFFIVGICGATYDILNHPQIVLLVTPLLLVFGCVLGYRHRHQFQACLFHMVSLWIFFMLGWAISTIQQNSFDEYVQWLDRSSQITGVVSDITHYPNMDRVRVQLPVRYWWSSPHHFLINVLNHSAQIKKGQTIRVNQRLSRITNDQIPFQFRARDYWALQHTSHEIFVYHSNKIDLLGTKTPSAIDRLRDKALVRLDTLYPNPDQAGILKALLVGQKDGLTTEVKSNFKNAGLLHVLAVSGLHVGIVFGILYLLLYPLHMLRIHKGWQYGIIICALWMYAIWTGLNVPVVRAVILMNFYLTAVQLRRQINSWNIYLWAVFIVLGLQPGSLFSVSFQLSFGAVAAILLFFKPIQRWLTPVLGKNYFTSLIAVSMAAQLGVIPLLLWHFQEISIVSTLSGLLVIPLLFPLILLSAASVLVPTSWTWMLESLSRLSQIIVDLILDMSEMIAGWAFSSAILVWHPITLVLLGIAILLGGLNLEVQKRYHHTWFRNTALGLITLSMLVETGNIYQHRTIPYAVLLEYRGEQITEFYYKGYGYSNWNETAPPFLQKLRKKYYAREVVVLDGDENWIKLFSSIHKRMKTSAQATYKSIQVINYTLGISYEIQPEDLMAEREPTSHRFRTKPVLSNLKPRDNE